MAFSLGAAVAVPLSACYGAPPTCKLPDGGFCQFDDDVDAGPVGFLDGGDDAGQADGGVVDGGGVDAGAADGGPADA